jgi:HlyD family secretion protein
LAIYRVRLRAEVEERDAAKVHVGQRVVAEADAYPEKTFEGSVTSISQSLGTPRTRRVARDGRTTSKW